MPAFSWNDDTQLKSRFEVVAKRLIAQSCPSPVTAEEVIQVFTPPELWSFYMTGRDMVVVGYGVDTTTVKAKIDNVPTEFYLSHSKVVVPPTPAVFGAEWAPPEIVAKLRAWLAQRREIGTQLGLAKHVLDKLCKECNSPGQVAFFWPAVKSLVPAGPENYALRERLSARLRPSSLMPTFSGEFRQAIRETAGLLAGLSFMDEADNEPHREVAIAPKFPPVQWADRLTVVPL